MSSKSNRVVPISPLKVAELPLRTPVYARLDELLEARRAASEALEVISDRATTGGYLKLLEEGRCKFRVLLEEACRRLDGILLLDTQCEGMRIATDHVSLLEYVRSTLAAFCSIASSHALANEVHGIQSIVTNDGGRAVADSIVALERLARNSLTQLLSIGPERILPRVERVAA